MSTPTDYQQQQEEEHQQQYRLLDHFFASDPLADAETKHNARAIANEASKRPYSCAGADRDRMLKRLDGAMTRFPYETWRWKAALRSVKVEQVRSGLRGELARTLPLLFSGRPGERAPAMHAALYGFVVRSLVDMLCACLQLQLQPEFEAELLARDFVDWLWRDIGLAHDQSGPQHFGDLPLALREKMWVGGPFGAAARGSAGEALLCKLEQQVEQLAGQQKQQQVGQQKQQQVEQKQQTAEQKQQTGGGGAGEQFAAEFQGLFRRAGFLEAAYYGPQREKRERYLHRLQREPDPLAAELNRRAARWAEAEKHGRRGGGLPPRHLNSKERRRIQRRSLGSGISSKEAADECNVDERACRALLPATVLADDCDTEEYREEEEYIEEEHREEEHREEYREEEYKEEEYIEEEHREEEEYREGEGYRTRQEWKRIDFASAGGGVVPSPPPSSMREIMSSQARMRSSDGSCWK